MADAPPPEKGRFIVVTGLPASGKTTLAKLIAGALALPLIDKDDILEALYDSVGIGNLDWRQKLSRASDSVFIRRAVESQGAILTSFWRHPSVQEGSGTPCEWLKELPGSVVEVYCRCPVEVALARFQRRSRHPGHNDGARLESDLVGQFRDMASRGPLAIGHLVEIDTSVPYDLDEIVATISIALGAAEDETA